MVHPTGPAPPWTQAPRGVGAAAGAAGRTGTRPTAHGLGWQVLQRRWQAEVGPRTAGPSLWALQEVGVQRRSAEVALEDESPARTRGRTFRQKEPHGRDVGGDALVHWGNSELCVWLGTGAEAQMGSDRRALRFSGGVFSGTAPSVSRVE